jgi:hypothetical protein
MNDWLPPPRPLAPREIEIQLGQLIRECLIRNSTDMASAIVQHIEALCGHPDYRGSWEERCAYRRLARHWNGLAWIFAEADVRQPVRPGAESRRSSESC